MFVKTQFGTIINLAYFERIEIKRDVRCERSEELHHYILAKSEYRENAWLAMFPAFPVNKSNAVESALEDLFQALSNDETTFDMRSRALKL